MCGGSAPLLIHNFLKFYSRTCSTLNNWNHNFLGGGGGSGPPTIYFYINIFKIWKIFTSTMSKLKKDNSVKKILQNANIDTRLYI